MYYREIARDGRVYVFNSAANADKFEKTGAIDHPITRSGVGPNGATVVADSPRALELYFFKHDIAEPVQEATPPPPPPWHISGLVFGDYYWFANDHDPAWEGQQGFWLRRAYFTYDHRLSSTITTRLRLEMNSDGKLEGGNITAYVKDAYVQWAYHGEHAVMLGIQPTATINWIEGFWGMRQIEKTPADLYRIDSSRDFSVSAEGSLGHAQAHYVAQFGNDSGNGSETDKYKAYRFEGRYERNSGIALEGFYGFFNRPDGQDRWIAQAFAGLRRANGRAAVQYLYQHRDSGGAAPDTTIGIVSAFGVFDVPTQKGSLFARVDWVNNPVPGADGIDYLPIDPTAKFTYFLAGYEWRVVPSLRVGPNVEVVSYRTASQAPDVRTDVVPRITFYWTW